MNKQQQLKLTGTFSFFMHNLATTPTVPLSNTPSLHSLASLHGRNLGDWMCLRNGVYCLSWHCQVQKRAYDTVARYEQGRTLDERL